MSHTLTYALLPLAGFVAGVINTIAGGGSFLTLPCLMLLGMPEQVANGTNRVAVAIQSAYAVPAYHRQQPIDWRTVPPLLATSLPGMAIGPRRPEASARRRHATRPTRPTAELPAR